MQSKTTREIEATAIGPKKPGPGGEECQEFLVADLSYDKGGANYFSGGRDPRGYSLIVRVETRGERFVSFEVFGGGIRAFIEPAKTFSAKRLADLKPDDDLIQRLKDNVMTKRAEAEARKEAARA